MTLSPPKDCPAYPSLVTVDQARQNNEPMPIQLGFDVDTKRETTSASIVAVINSNAAIARALDRGDLLHAHIATLHLQIPDPPPLAKATRSASEVVALAKQLHASGLLKRGWDPSKHPRWPAGSLDSVGRRFAPADETLGAAPGYESSASTRRRKHCQYRLRP